MKFLYKGICGIVLLLVFANVAAQRQAEYLNRGVHAANTGDGKVFVSWRLLADDATGIAFNLYRTTAGKTIKLNAAPLTKGTDFIDAGADTKRPIPM